MRFRFWTVVIDILIALNASSERAWRYAWLRREQARGDVRYEDMEQ